MRCSGACVLVGKWWEAIGKANKLRASRNALRFLLVVVASLAGPAAFKSRLDFDPVRAAAQTAAKERTAARRTSARVCLLVG